MTIPDFQTLMLPVLQSAADGEVRIADVVQRLAAKFKLTAEERAELLPSGRQTIFANRVHWAKSFLGKAALVELTRRGHFRITDRGRNVLATPLFATTSSFSASARETAEFLSKRIALIDGWQLAKLMIRYDVGCRVEETIQIKKVDEEFFE